MAAPQDTEASPNDDNLLFAMLALVEAVIDRDQLASAYSEWMNRQGTMLADILTERGWLRPEDRAKVEQSIHRHRSLAIQETQSTLDDRTSETRPESLGTLGSRDTSSQEETLLRPREPGDGLCEPGRDTADRYTLLRLHAQGGVGQVWLARDGKLGREVALKELRPRQSLEPVAQARFVEEARVTGQLQHPGIVPVYELSRHEDDARPFYTMRFLKGKTLTEAVQAYHKRRVDGEATSLDLRELLSAFQAVCHALAYAHSRGVLHRDLKGQNVVLGDFGEVMVLDWGLAKVIGEKAAPASPNRMSAEPSEVNLEQDSWEKTLEGSILGTPGFMAVEQAEGRLDDLDQRTDVYGLGAILYHILTGEPPFTGATTAEILFRVKTEPPRPPRKHVASIAPELEAVVLKCLAKDPAGRYESAAELAREIRNYLADEPVSAYPEPWSRRTRRWLSRHRTLATASAATLLVATVSLAVAAVLLGAANDREAKARAQAESHFELARGAVDRFFNKVGDDPRLKAHGLEKLRQDLLKQAQGYYEKFVQERSVEPSVEAERGLTYIQLAKITGELGQAVEAIPLSEQACTIFAKLAANHPSITAYRVGFAKANVSLGNAYLANNQVAEAKNAFETADAAWEGLSRRDPTSSEFRFQRAVTLNRLGKLVALVMQQPVAGEKILELSLQLGNQLVKEKGGKPEYRNERAETLLLLGFSRFTSDFDQSKIMLESALKVREELAREHPDEPQYQSNLVDTCVFIAVSYYNAGVPQRVEAVFDLVRPISQRLANDHPDVAIFVENDALITTILAGSRAARGDHTAARKLAEEAVARAPRSGMVSLYAACFYSMASEHGRRDPKLDEVERVRFADEYLKKSMELLVKARDSGLFQQRNFLEGLDTDPDLAPLRKRDEFKKFQSELKKNLANPGL